MKRSKGNRLFPWVSAAAACIALGCGSDKPAEDPGSYNQQYSAELQQERQDFINGTQERLNELENRIGQLQARLENERQYVSESQAAEWSQELFDLQLERREAQARLERAQTADQEEWEAMRGGLGSTLDSIEARLDAIGSSIANVFQGDDEPAEDQRQPVGGQDEEPSGESDPDAQ